MNLFTKFRKTLRQFGIEYFDRYYGSYRGYINNNKDPKNLGRVRVVVPEVYGDESVRSYWAWPKGIYCGKQIGAYAIPNIGDKVWVEFEKGDPRYPIWNYGWWGTGDVPEAAKNNGKKPTNNIFQTTAGHLIECDDENSLIRITDSNGNVVEMNEKGISIGSKEESAEPALLGDTTVQMIEDILTALEGVTVATAIGPQPFLNLPQFTALKQQLEPLKSQKVTLD